MLTELLRRLGSLTSEAKPEQPTLLDVAQPRRPWRWQAMVTGVAVAVFVLVFGWYALRSYRLYAVPGFDTGIFAQGTYLLSRFESPFVTLRGLQILGDHSSLILVLLAPIFWLWADARVLLLAQVVAVSVPAIVTYRLAVERLGATVAMVLAVVFLLMPTLQWTVIWHFHPEGLATAFLALALYGHFRDKPRLLVAMVVLALMCKEDVSFVVFAFGLVLALEGRRRLGAGVALGAALYFLVATFVLMPLINGRGNLYFERNYGIELQGIESLLVAIPILLARAVAELNSADGVVYLAVLLGPLLFTPLLRARWLLPIVPPILLNFASLIPYQQEIKYQYLATSVPFVMIAAVEGLKRLRTIGPVWPMATASLVVTCLLANSFGPQGHLIGIAKSEVDARILAIDHVRSLVPRGAKVSALYNVSTHLSQRTHVYEFPNPFHASNYSFPDSTGASPSEVEAVEYVLVEPDRLDGEPQRVYEQLLAAPNWKVLAEVDGVVLLSKTSPTPLFSELPRPEKGESIDPPNLLPLPVEPAEQ